MCWLLKPGVRVPLHCPFDGIIIKELDKSVHHIKRTKMVDIEQYKALVSAAREIAGSRNTTAAWELEAYGVSVNYG